MWDRMRGEAGFTLIELMLVVVVLGILAGIVMYTTGDVRHAAADSVGKANYRACKTAKAASLARWGHEGEYRRFLENAADPC